jgi:hypothetical protein
MHLAELFNQGRNTAGNGGRHWRHFSIEAIEGVSPNWSNPWYNLGLQAKYRGNWRASLKYNTQAVLLHPEDQAS